MTNSDTKNQAPEATVLSDDSLCLCGSEKSYGVCCAVFHRGELAPTPEALMRSRYAAYAMGLVDYVINTTHRENSEYKKNTILWKREVLGFCRDTEFLKLDILDTGAEETVGHVKFCAKVVQKGQPLLMTELSRFKKAGKRWLYHSGETDVVMDEEA